MYLSKCLRSGLALAMIYLHCHVNAQAQTPTDPPWWAERGVKSAFAANNKGPVNIGQLKKVMHAAALELEERLPNGAGSTLRNLVSSWPVIPEAQNKQPVNQGQLKHHAQFVYDRLYEEGYVSAYPWDLNGSPLANNYAPAQLGQLKNLFSFDLEKDVDTDGVADMLEAASGESYNGSSIGGLPDNDDSDLDGLPDAIDPNDANRDIDGDGALDGDDADINRPQIKWPRIRASQFLVAAKIPKTTVGTSDAPVAISDDRVVLFPKKVWAVRNNYDLLENPSNPVNLVYDLAAPNPAGGSGSAASTVTIAPNVQATLTLSGQNYGAVAINSNGRIVGNATFNITGGGSLIRALEWNYDEATVQSGQLPTPTIINDEAQPISRGITTRPSRIEAVEVLENGNMVAIRDEQYPSGTGFSDICFLGVWPGDRSVSAYPLNHNPALAPTLSYKAGDGRGNLIFHLSGNVPQRFDMLSRQINPVNPSGTGPSVTNPRDIAYVGSNVVIVGDSHVSVNGQVVLKPDGSADETLNGKSVSERGIWLGSSGLNVWIDGAWRLIASLITESGWSNVVGHAISPNGDIIAEGDFQGAPHFVMLTLPGATTGGGATPPQPQCYSFANDDATGPRFRKVALNGMPMADEKPQATEESDAHKEETYVDAFDRSFNHHTTDIYVPLGGSELALQVTRNAVSDITSDRHGLTWRHDRPFGPCWATNLTAHIAFVETYRRGSGAREPVSITVQDESGRTYPFGTYNGRNYFPMPTGKVEKKTHLHSLRHLGGGRFEFKKKFGNTLIYQVGGPAMQSVALDRIHIDGGKGKQYFWWARLMQVKDRSENTISYKFNAGNNSLVPNEIIAGQGRNQKLVITMTASGANIQSIADPRNNVIYYNYANRPVPWTPPVAPPWNFSQIPVLTHVAAQLEVYPPPGLNFTNKGYFAFYDYETQYPPAGGGTWLPNTDDRPEIWESNDPRKNHPDMDRQVIHYHWNLKSIAGGRRPSAQGTSVAATTIEYEWDRTKYGFCSELSPTKNYVEKGNHRLVKKVIMPDPTSAGPIGTTTTFEYSTGASDFSPDGSTWPATSMYMKFLYPRWLLTANVATRVTTTSSPTSTSRQGRSWHQFLDSEIVDVEKVFGYRRPTSPNSSQLIVSYKKMKIWSEVTAGSTIQETYTFDPSAGLALASAVDASGNQTSYQYSSTWNDAPPAFAIIAKSRYFGKFDDPTEESNALGHVTYFDYEGNFRLMKEVRKTRATIPIARTLYSFDAFGNRTDERMYGFGAVVPRLWTTFEYNDPKLKGFLTRKTAKRIGSSDPSWAVDMVTEYQSDSAGQVFKETTYPTSSTPLASESLYDANNNRISFKDPRGNTTTFTYDPRNRLTGKTLPSTVVDPSASTPVSVQTSHVYEYDDNGNRFRETETRAQGGNSYVIRTIHGYDFHNRLIATRLDIDNNNSTLVDIVGTEDPGEDLVTKFAYNARDAMVSKTDPKGNVVNTVYDLINRPTSTTAVAQSAADNKTTSYSYGANSGSSVFNTSGFKPTSITSPRNFVTNVTYDALYRPVLTSQGYGPSKVAETSVQYLDSVGTVITGRDGRRNAITYQTGKKTTVKSKIAGDASTPDDKTTSEYYDGLGRLILTIEGERATDQVVEAGSGNTILTSSRLLRKDTELKYSSTGLLAATYFRADTSIAPLATDYRETFYQYDGAGRKTAEIFPHETTGEAGTSSAATKTAYDANGNVTRVTDARGLTITGATPNFTVAENAAAGSPYSTDYAYDARNRKWQETLPSVLLDAATTGTRSTIKTAYQDHLNSVAVTDARGNVTTNEFDRAGRMTGTTFPAVVYHGQQAATSATRTQEYDKNGNVTTVTDENGNTTTNEYDAFNRLTTTTTAIGQVIERSYDQHDNLVYVNQKNGASNEINQITRFQYDGLNRKTKEQVDADTIAIRKETNWVYGPATLSQRLDPNGGIVDYTYDGMHRLASRSYNLGRAEDNQTLSYDGAGNLAAVDVLGVAPDAGARDVEYVYDKRDRLINEISGRLRSGGVFPAGSAHVHAYDLVGNRVSITYGNSGGVMTCSYDGLNRLKSCTHAGRTTTYQYDASGNVTRVGSHNGVAATKVYNARHWPTSINTAGSSGLESYVYGYDKVGNTRSITETHASAGLGLPIRQLTLTYDAVDRLTQENQDSGASVTSFVYDRANNRTQRTVNNVVTNYTYGPDATRNSNQLISASGGISATFTYDLNGNRASKTEGGVTTTYSYDCENRLIRVDKGPAIYTYSYDHRTRRVARSGPGTALRVSYVGGTSAQEYDASNNPVAQYIRGSDMGGGVGGILYSLRGAQVSYFHYNSRGDVTTKTGDNASLTYQARYRAFGTRAAEVGAAQNADNQRANTKEEESDLGLLNEHMRYRDLEYGVFLTRDPAGFVDGPNVYSYVRQNPWSKFDPLGLKMIADYEKDIAEYKTRQAQDEYKAYEAMDRAGGRRTGFSDYYADCARVYGDLVLGAKLKIAKIENTAREIAEFNKEWVDPRMLDDADQTYKDFNSALRTARFIPGSGITENIAKGNNGKAAEVFAKELALALAGGAVFKALGAGGSAAAETGGRAAVSFGDDLSSAAGTRVWRHVAEGHPALADAQAGVVRPYGPTMDAPLAIRAMSHDIGYTQGSGLTSWTADEAWALARQQRMGGVVLKTVAPEGSIWFNQAAKGAESQVLVPGVIRIK